MPIRPFPSPFRIGIDIIRVARMRSLVSQRDDLLQRFLRKIFTTRERRYIKALFPNIPGASKHEVTYLTEYLASRYARACLLWQSVPAEQIRAQMGSQRSRY